MYGTQRALSAYKMVGVETGVASADPHKLILMLFDGALIAVGDARRHLAEFRTAERGIAISKCIMIIENGLKASLDRQSSGELAGRLSDLYDYMRDRLLQANLHVQDSSLSEVQQLLGELREAWSQMQPPANAHELRNMKGAA
ncbi:MAG: flagellar export chaperone FliS [Burkholderiales bacterium]